MLSLRSILLFGFLLLQAPAADYVLTDAERVQWQQFAQQEQQLGQQLSQIVNQAGAIEVSPSSSMQVHAALKDNLAAQALIRARRDAFQAQLRADHGCKDCVVENGKLVPPAKK